MFHTIRHHARFFAALTVAIASGFGLAVAVEGPLSNLGLVDHFAMAREPIDPQRGFGMPVASRSFQVQAFDHSQVVLPLLVGDLAWASNPATRTTARRMARVRPSLLTVPFASK